MIKRLIKIGAEALLGGEALGPLLKHRTAGKDLILGYHNVIPDGESPAGSLSLHVRFKAFIEQIRAASDEHQIVSLTRILDEPPGER